MEIPPKVSGVSAWTAKRSWIVLDEFNEFAWPGFDLRPVPGKPGAGDMASFRGAVPEDR